MQQLYPPSLSTIRVNSEMPTCILYATSGLAFLQINIVIATGNEFLSFTVVVIVAALPDPSLVSEDGVVRFFGTKGWV